MNLLQILCLTILLSLVPNFAYQDSDSSLQAPSLALKPLTVVMEMIDADGPWQSSYWILNPDTGEYQIYYHHTNELTYADYFIDSNARQAYVLVSNVHAALNGFQLLQFDLNTGRQKTLLEKKNLRSVFPYPPEDNHLILGYRPENEQWKPGVTPEYCLFNLQNLNCEPIEQEVAYYMPFGHSWLLKWLNKSEFLTTDLQRVNIFTGEVHAWFPNEPIVFTIPFHKRDEYLVAIGDSQRGATMHNLNLMAHQYSNSLYSIPRFSKMISMSLSPEDDYLLYFAAQASTPEATLIDNHTGKIIFTSSNTDLIWLPDGHHLLGSVVSTEKSHSDIIRIDARTGEVDKLFEIDNPVNLIMIP
jgi:hypothetical protein